MNIIESCIRNVERNHAHGSDARILAYEVKRLREQLKEQEENFAFYRVEGTLYGTKYWIQKKEKKEMTVDEALELAETAEPNWSSNILANEVKRLREFDNERASIIREKNEEIRRLREVVERRDERIHELRTFLKNATGKLSKIRAML